jgi:hypothetical protein
MTAAIISADTMRAFLQALELALDEVQQVGAGLDAPG